MAGLFHVLYGNGDGTFRKAEVLNGTDGKPLILPGEGDDELTEKICTRPFAVDWDGDGHLDLVVGNFEGTFYWFKGQGKGKFLPKAEKIMAGKSPLRIEGGHSDPFVIDLNGDGALDLVSGSSEGGVYWAENKAGKGKTPEFRSFRTLIKPNPPVKKGPILREKDLTGPTTMTRVWVADVNGDGKLDVLVGDNVRLISPVDGLSDAEFAKKHAEWEKSFNEALEAMEAAKDEKSQEKATEEYRKMYSRRFEFMREERTGFVWVYLQK